MHAQTLHKQCRTAFPGATRLNKWVLQGTTVRSDCHCTRYRTHTPRNAPYGAWGREAPGVGARARRAQSRAHLLQHWAPAELKTIIKHLTISRARLLPAQAEAPAPPGPQCKQSSPCAELTSEFPLRRPSLLLLLGWPQVPLVIISS